MKKNIIILLLFYSSSLFSQNQLGNQNSFYHFLKFSDVNLKEYVADYMDKNFEGVWQKYENDEFDFENKKEEYLKKLIDEVSSHEPYKEYIVQTRSNFEEYNFEGEYFSFHPLSSATYLPHYRTGSCSPCTYYTSVNLFFNNTEDFYNIELDKEEANRLIKSRKSNSGSIDKDVRIRIIYELLNKVDYEKEYSRVNVTLMGTIKSIEVYDQYGYKEGTGRMIQKMFPKDTIPSNQSSNSTIIKEKPINKEVTKLETYIKTLDLSEELKSKLFELLEEFK